MRALRDLMHSLVVQRLRTLSLLLMMGHSVAAAVMMVIAKPGSSTI